jgi:hypothetical protein
MARRLRVAAAQLGPIDLAADRASPSSESGVAAAVKPALA